MSVVIKSFSGEDIRPYLLDLARLRLHIFREYPYLYEGTLDCEKKYLAHYVECPESIVLLAFDQQRVIGAATALPMKDESEEVKAPFIQSHFNLNHIMYFGELILLPEYRSKKIGYQLFTQLENITHQSGYKMAAFCTVEPLLDHPKKPTHWQSLDNFWQQLGYQKHPELTVTFHWKEVDESDTSPKTMTFWLKTYE